MIKKTAVLYDNLEFNNVELRDVKNEEKSVSTTPTVMEEYENDYRWNDENMGRVDISTLISVVKRGFK